MAVDFIPKTLQPFRFWCQKVLPLVYDDSLSYYELLCKVVDYLNKLMEDTNMLTKDMAELSKSFAELTEYVNEYFSDLNVQNEVNNKLDAMAESGELDRLLELATYKCRYFNIEFVGRTFAVNNYRSAQAMCTRTISNKLWIYTCYYNYETGISQRSVIQKMDTQGVVAQESDPIFLDHSNDMCYNANTNCFIVCGYNSNEVFEIDADTLELKNTYSLETNIIAITYDAENDCYYTFNAGVFRKYNNDFTETEVLFTNDAFLKYGVETIEYFKGYLYVTQNAPNSLSVFNLSGKLLTVGMVQDFASNYYPIGEMQAISIYNEDGDFIVNGKPREVNLFNNDYEIGHGITTFGKGNVLCNTTYLTRYTQASIPIYYGRATIKADTPIFKPVGTGAEPFNTLGDMLICLTSPVYKPTEVTIGSDFPDEDLVLINKNIYVNGNGHTVKNIYADHFYNSLYNIVATNLTALNSIMRIHSIVCSNITCTYCLIANNNVDLSSATINNCSIVNKYVKRTTLYDETLNAGDGVLVTLADSVNNYTKLTFQMILDNNRIVDTKQLNVSDMTSAIYLGGFAGLTDAATVYRSVIIFSSATTFTIAGANVRYRIIGE